MERDSFGSAELQPHNKPKWHTPVLSHEQVVVVTNGDTNTFGSDGQTTTFGTPLQQTS